MKKLKLTRELIKVLTSAELSRAGGGAPTEPTQGQFCTTNDTNTVQICVDTTPITNCGCNTNTWQCPVFSARC